VFSGLAGSEAAETLGTTGVLALFEKELGVDPETDIEALVVLDAFSTASLMDVTRDEFVRGMRRLQIKDLASLKQALPRLTDQSVHSASEFKRFYVATYHRAKAPGSKVVAKELCVGLWPILLNTDAKRARHVDAFVAYVNKREDLGFISADLWVRRRDPIRRWADTRSLAAFEQTSFLAFSLAIEPDLSNFDSAGAWPLVLDDFVMQAKAN